MSFLKHVGKASSKFQYEVQVLGVEGLPVHSSEAVYAEVSRGSKSFVTRVVVSEEEGSARWDETISLVSTLYRAKKEAMGFTPKLYTVRVRTSLEAGQSRRASSRKPKAKHSVDLEGRIDLAPLATVNATQTQQTVELFPAGHFAAAAAAGTPTSSAAAAAAAATASASSAAAATAAAASTLPQSAAGAQDGGGSGGGKRRSGRRQRKPVLKLSIRSYWAAGGRGTGGAGAGREASVSKLAGGGGGGGGGGGSGPGGDAMGVGSADAAESPLALANIESFVSRTDGPASPASAVTSPAGGYGGGRDGGDASSPGSSPAKSRAEQVLTKRNMSDLDFRESADIVTSLKSSSVLERLPADAAEDSLSDDDDGGAGTSSSNDKTAASGAATASGSNGRAAGAASAAEVSRTSAGSNPDLTPPESPFESVSSRHHRSRSSGDLNVMDVLSTVRRPGPGAGTLGVPEGGASKRSSLPAGFSFRAPLQQVGDVSQRRRSVSPRASKLAERAEQSMAKAPEAGSRVALQVEAADAGAADPFVSYASAYSGAPASPPAAGATGLPPRRRLAKVDRVIVKARPASTDAAARRRSGSGSRSSAARVGSVPATSAREPSASSIDGGRSRSGSSSSAAAAAAAADADESVSGLPSLSSSAATAAPGGDADGGSSGGGSDKGSGGDGGEKARSRADSGSRRRRGVGSLLSPGRRSRQLVENAEPRTVATRKDVDRLVRYAFAKPPKVTRKLRRRSSGRLSLTPRGARALDARGAGGGGGGGGGSGGGSGSSGGAGAGGSGAAADGEQQATPAELQRRARFWNGIPVSACMVIRCMVEWGAFDARASRWLVDQFVHAMVESTSGMYDEPAELSYGLSNTVTLLHFLKQLRLRDARRWDPEPLPADVATLFEQAENQVRMLASRSFRALLRHYLSMAGTVDVAGLLDPRQPDFEANPQMRRLLTTYASVLDMMAQYHLPPSVREAMMGCLFRSLDCSVFNLLLQRSEFLVTETGIRLQMVLSVMLQWCCDASGNALRAQCHGRLVKTQELSNLLMVPKDGLTTLAKVTDLCPTVSLAQLEHVLAMYNSMAANQDDRIDPTVMTALRLMLDGGGGGGGGGGSAGGGAGGGGGGGGSRLYLDPFELPANTVSFDVAMGEFPVSLVPPPDHLLSGGAAFQFLRPRGGGASEDDEEGDEDESSMLVL